MAKTGDHLIFGMLRQVQGGESDEDVPVDQTTFDQTLEADANGDLDQQPHSLTFDNQETYKHQQSNHHNFIKVISCSAPKKKQTNNKHKKQKTKKTLQKWKMQPSRWKCLCRRGILVWSSTWMKEAPGKEKPGLFSEWSKQANVCQKLDHVFIDTLSSMDDEKDYGWREGKKHFTLCLFKNLFVSFLTSTYNGATLATCVMEAVQRSGKCIRFCHFWLFYFIYFILYCYSLKQHIPFRSLITNSNNIGEAKTSEMINILDYFHRWVPQDKQKNPVPTFLYGDGLTCKKAKDGIGYRVKAEGQWWRLQGIEIWIQEWHKIQLWMQVSTQSRGLLFLHVYVLLS